MSIKQYLHRSLNNPWLFDFVRHILDGGQIEPISRILSTMPSTRVLDIACGTGYVSRAVPARVNYLGVDISHSFIAYAKRRHGGPYKQFSVMDAMDIRLRPKDYDLTMLVSAIHHFTDEEVIQMLIRAAELTTQHVLVVDGIPKQNPISRFFYAIDRGAYIRTFEEQKALIARTKCLEIIREEAFDSTSRIYAHSVLLAKVIIKQ